MLMKLLKDDIQRWACTKRGCKCAIKLSADRKFIVEKCNDHNHENVDEKVLNRQKMRKAMTDISSRPAKLICTELKKDDMETLDSND
ncbi:hypothetical protein M8J77_000857 [Diaphorina citri]|nr:hypothetical protein M8J77_000857 [Diaphorina citri]